MFSLKQVILFAKEIAHTSLVICVFTQYITCSAKDITASLDTNAIPMATLCSYKAKNKLVAIGGTEISPILYARHYSVFDATTLQRKKHFRLRSVNVKFFLLSKVCEFFKIISALSLFLHTILDFIYISQSPLYVRIYSVISVEGTNIEGNFKTM